MPNVDGELVSPDDVIRRGLCPECGKRLDIKSARHHAEDHWGIDPNSNRLSEEGRRRFNLILGFVGGKIGQPAMPETPSHDNRAFWIDQIIAGVIFAAGFDIMRDHLVLGVIVSALGLGWLVYLRWERKRMTPLVRTPSVLAVAVLVLATAVMGYDIYDRGDGRSSFPSNCVNYQYTEIDSHQFSHETVRLDGRKFVNCSFDNVTFKFEGTAPFQFIPYPPVTIGDIKVRSDVPVVKSFNVCLLGCKPSSVDNSPTIP